MSRPSKAPKRGSSVMEYSDPIIHEGIKSQVEDAELIGQRRKQIVRTAISLFYHKGYHVTTIKEIASAAGVSPGLIYQYVNDKEDILFLALQLIVHTYRSVLPKAIERVDNPLHKFVVAFEEYCWIIDANRDASALTYSETKSLPRARREAIKQMEYGVNELLAAPLREAMAAGLVREVDVELFISLATVAIHSWALKHWRLKKVTDIETFVETNLDILLSSVMTAAGRRSYQAYRRTAAARLPGTPGA